MQQNQEVKIAPPRDRNSIRKDTFKLRRQLGLEQGDRIDILTILELVIPRIDTEFHLLPVEDKELLGRYAETRPYEHVIYVKQSVYEAATRNGGWARMILAHELGHYYYHDASSVSFAYIDRSESLDPDCNPERQADIFAAELLAPSGALKGMTAEEVKQFYGVSLLAAKNQLRQASNIAHRRALKKKKRSGKNRPTARQ